MTRGDGESSLTAGRAENGGQRINLRDEVHHRAERITHSLRSGSLGWLVGGQSAPHDATRLFGNDAVLGSPCPRDAMSREGGGSGEGERGAHFWKDALQTSNLHARDRKRVRVRRLEGGCRRFVFVRFESVRARERIPFLVTCFSVA